MQKALALEVARELNISPELAYTVCKSFHDGIRTLLKDPVSVKTGIHIQGLITLRLSEKKLLKAQVRKGDDETITKTLEQYGKHKRKKYTKKKQACEKGNNA